MPIMKIEIPKILIDGVEFPEEFLKKSRMITLIKEVGNIDRVLIEFIGENISLLDVKSKCFESNGKRYKIVEVD